MSERPPAKCTACQVNRVAWSSPRVDFCYSCLPGGPFQPPPCRLCGSQSYFSDGLCDVCHLGGPRRTGSCRGCLAWGVTRKHNWRCFSCRWWRCHYPLGDCRFCGRRSEISGQGACRLCWHTFRTLQVLGIEVDLASANHGGQQLFLANTFGNLRPVQQTKREYQAQRRAKARLAHPEHHYRKPLSTLAEVERDRTFTPLQWRQLRLFELEVDPALVVELAGTADSELLRYCDAVALEHGERHGWSTKHINDVRRGLRLLQVQQVTPGAKFLASEVARLTSITANVSMKSTLEVLEAAGLLEDDRLAKIERLFLSQFSGLPETMGSQLRTWCDVMTSGSEKAPRRKPRDPMTARIQIRAIAPALRVWASTGHESLAEITKEDVVAVLPGGGAQRVLAEAGLRSLFEILKARRVIFANPMRGLPVTRATLNIPLPLDTEAIRSALNSPDPATALAVALVAFHAIRSAELRCLKLIDIVDGRLRIGERDVPLAAPVLERLRAWLDHRQATWPSTINPHLFVNRHSAPRLTPVGRPFPWKQVQFKAQTLREDRILAEVLATGGDVKAVCELFGMSVEGVLRYLPALGADAMGERSGESSAT